MKTLLQEVKSCTLCSAHLPKPPKPILAADPESKILLIGQAPGIRVHESGILWNDASGKKLREWLNMDNSTFYNTQNLAVVPMGFCYPGKGRSGDLPPRPECAPLWHDRIISKMNSVQLILLVGKYAQQYYLKEGCKKNLAETVRAYQEYLPHFFPLPHPSPRNNIWLKRNSWFKEDVIPVLQKKVSEIL